MRLKEFIINRCKRIRDCQGGVAYIEFAITVGVLLLLFFGGVEVTRYVLIIQKLEKTAFTVADVATQYSALTTPPDPLTKNAFLTMMTVVPNMMNPYSFNNNGFIYLTDVFGQPNPIDPTKPATPVVQWQLCGGGTLSVPSKIANGSGVSIQGTTANLSSIPGNFTIQNNEEVIISEVFYQFQPITMQNFLPPVQIQRTALYMPRLGGPTSNPTTLTCP